MELLLEKEEYLLSEFIRIHGSGLPKIVYVTQGFCSENMLETLDRGQVQNYLNL